MASDAQMVLACEQHSHNFPASMMSRSIYQFTPQILDFTNKPGKLMVLYELGNAWHLLVQLVACICMFDESADCPAHEDVRPFLSPPFFSPTFFVRMLFVSDLFQWGF